MSEGKISSLGGSRGPVKILGAIDTQNTPTPEILDRKTKQDGTPVEIVTHAETITEANKIRGRKVNVGDPEVRLRDQPSQAEWDKAKRLSDD